MIRHYHKPFGNTGAAASDKAEKGTTSAIHHQAPQTTDHSVKENADKKRLAAHLKTLQKRISNVNCN